MAPVRRPAAVTAVMCLAMMTSVADVFVFATLIRTFEAEWGLSKVQQGWISGIYFVGYTLVVPVLLAVTDRVDARRIHMAGNLVIAAGAAGFALCAEGFWSAMAFRALSGCGLAAVYMPGLRVLVDRLAGGNESRAIALYTASWPFGVSLSFLTTSAIGEHFGWQTAFLVNAGAALAAFLLVALLLGPVPPHRAGDDLRLLDFRPVFRNRAAMGLICGYAAHNFELVAYRAWLVAFLAFCLTQQAVPAVTWLAEPARIAAVTASAAILASIVGNELAIRLGRTRFIVAAQLAGTAFAGFLGFTAGEAYSLVIALVIVHSFLIQADAAPLTAGLVDAAEPGRRGATLAVYNFVGWGGGFLGPVAVGLVLDLFGKESIAGWGFGYATMGALGILGALAVAVTASRRPTPANQR